MFSLFTICAKLFSFITYRFPALHAVRSDCLLYYSLTFYACCAINSYRQYIIAYRAPVRIKYIKHALCNILKCIICNYLYSSISIMRLQSVEYLFCSFTFCIIFLICRRFCVILFTFCSGVCRFRWLAFFRKFCNLFCLCFTTS